MKTTSEKPKTATAYINLEFHEGRRLKNAAGIAEHRNGDDKAEFHGDPLEECYQECLDQYNLLEQVERQYGANTSILKSQSMSMALTLQRIKRVYPRSQKR